MLSFFLSCHPTDPNIHPGKRSTPPGLLAPIVSTGNYPVLVQLPVVPLFNPPDSTGTGTALLHLQLQPENRKIDELGDMYASSLYLTQNFHDTPGVRKSLFGR